MHDSVNGLNMNAGSMAIAPNEIQPQIAGDAERQLLIHLDNEKTSLEEMLQAVRGVHTALKNLNDVELRKWLDHEAVILQAAEGVKQRRQELRNLLARELRIRPDEVTLTRIIDSTEGGLRDEIERKRKTLSEMSIEMNKLNQQNAAMIRQSAELTRGIISRLTGTPQVSGSYNSHGGLDVPPPKSLVQWGG
jgi:hypothetical protein